MSLGINEGIGTAVVVQAESAFLGAGTGPAYAFPGKTGLVVSPRLEATTPRTGAWRGQDGEAYAARWFEASLEAEWAQGEATALLLSSLLARSGVSPNYTFARPGAARRSLILSVTFAPSGPTWVLRGLLAQRLDLTIRARGIVTFKMEFSAGRLDTSGAVAATVTPDGAPAAGWKSSALYNGAAMDRAYELALSIVARTQFKQFGEDSAPTRHAPAGGAQFSAEVSEWMGDTSAEGDRVAGDARNLIERAQQFDVTPAAGQLLRLSFPRALMRNGTPPALQRAGIAYRIGSEAQAGEVGADWPTITMNI